MIDFLSYIRYIIFSDQIVETREACDRGRMLRLLSFFIRKFFNEVDIRLAKGRYDNED